ncbi:MAG: hypothetical protein KDC05_15835 [Bacteroidales bacterium]|nr:hypothetical protein [Bacteroidales bacterium]
MKKIILAFAVLATVLSSCKKDEDNNSQPMSTQSEYFLVANRGSSTVTVFDASTLNKEMDITLPGTGADPTYLAYSKERAMFYVGDFANQKLYAYGASDFMLKHSIDIQEGAFHMWLSDASDQLWVNNIVSKTTSVVSLSSNSVIETIGLPTQDINLTTDAVQHDVVLSANGDYAFITILDGTDVSYVVQYATADFSYMRHATIGGDAHLLIVDDKLFATSQEGNAITVFKQSDLSEVSTISINAPHGVAYAGSYFYTAQTPAKGLGVISLSDYSVVSTQEALYDAPHNLAVNEAGSRLFLSHSGGTATKVVLYEISGASLTKKAEMDSGTNPFGVLYFKY